MKLFNTGQKNGIPQSYHASGKEEELLHFLETPRSRKEVVEYLGLSSAVYAIQTYVTPLVERGLIRLTIPEKPSSRNQRFVRAK